MDQVDLATHESEVMAATERLVRETKQILAELREANATFHCGTEKMREEIAEAQRMMRSYPADQGREGSG